MLGPGEAMKVHGASAWVLWSCQGPCPGQQWWLCSLSRAVSKPGSCVGLGKESLSASERGCKYIPYFLSEEGTPMGLGGEAHTGSCPRNDLERGAEEVNFW